MRHGTTHFGADGHLYELLAQGTIHDRIARFHPLIVALSLAWMKLLAPLAQWISPAVLLQALFALIGAAGAGAATAVFASQLGQRWLAVLCGMIYASSLGIWYFSAIPESKILTASLSAFYILSYIRLRAQWTTSRYLVLTAVLFAACMNEIVSCFLVIVPFVDTILRRGWHWHAWKWIGAHALAVLLSFVFLEWAINGTAVTATDDPESRSHISMLIFYVLKSDYSISSLYAFAINWLFFNIAAPSSATPLWPHAGGYFEPSLVPYFASPLTALLPALLVLIVGAGLSPDYKSRLTAECRALLFAVASYAGIRAAFFVVFNPAEPLLFSPAVTLAHCMIVFVPFAASRFAAKMPVLLALWGILVFANGRFILG